MNKKIILASQSPRRKELLSYIIKEFEIFPSNVDETIEPEITPEDAVKALSLKKASFVAQKFPNSIIIGSDTVVVFGNKIIGKADSINEARETLQSMSGQEHFVFTGITIIDSSDNSINQEIVKTVVKFREIPEYLLNDYLTSGEYEDKAGSYAIQGKGALFIDYINGDFYNVMGFPINTLYKMLDRLGHISH